LKINKFLQEYLEFLYLRTVINDKTAKYIVFF